MYASLIKIENKLKKLNSVRKDCLIFGIIFRTPHTYLHILDSLQNISLVNLHRSSYLSTFSISYTLLLLAMSIILYYTPNHLAYTPSLYIIEDLHHIHP